MRREIRRCLLVLAASSLIAACGGGGGSTSAPVTNASISGSVSQGSAGAASIGKQAAASPIAGAKVTIKSFDTAGNLRQTVETVSTGTGDFIAKVAALAGGGWISIKIEKDNAVAFEKTFPYKTGADLAAGLNIQAQLDPIIAKVIPVFNNASGLDFRASAGGMVSIAIVEDSKGAKKIVTNNDIVAAKAAGGNITWQLDVAKQVLAAAGTTSLTVKAQNYNPADPNDMTRFPADNADNGDRLVSAAFDFIDIKDQNGNALTIPKATAKEIRKSAAVAYAVKKQIPDCKLIVKDEDAAKAGVQVGFYFMRNGKWTKLGNATLYLDSTPDDTRLFPALTPGVAPVCASLPYAVLTDADISKDIDFDLKWFNFDYVAFGEIKTACIAGDFKLTKNGVDEPLGSVSVNLNKLEQPVGTDVRGFRSSYGYSKNDGKYQIDFTYNNSSFNLSNPLASLSYTDPVTYQYNTFTQTLSAKNADGCYVIDTRKTSAPECAVTGKVVKQDNTTPIANRAVNTYQTGSYGGSRWAYTDTAGNFSIPAICSVNYTLTVDNITKTFNVNGTTVGNSDENVDAANVVTMKNIPKANQAPSAYIYADNSSVALNNGVNLEGYGWDPDGDNVTYAWSTTCGSFFDSATQATGTATSSKFATKWKAPAAVPANNLCTITLTTSDGSLQGTAATDIYVSAGGNRPPIITNLLAPATARTSSLNELAVYAYDANSGDTLTYTWGATCGTLANSASPSQQTWTAPATGGNCTVTATVSDGTDSVNKSATIVVAANKPPIITGMFVPPTAAYGKARTFSASAYDPDGDNITYAWTATCGTLANAATTTPTWTAPATANTPCNVTLAVSDGTASVSQTKTVTTTTNSAPVITSVGPTSAQVSSRAQLTGQASDADGDSLSWSWTIKSGGGTLSGTCSGTGAPPLNITSCTYSTPATDETATLTFTVNDGVTPAVTRDLTISVTSVTGGFGVTVR